MNLDALKQRLSALQNPKGDKTNYEKKDLWKPTVGKHHIRIVPAIWDKQNPFKEVFLHYDIGNKTMISPKNFDEKDPIIEFANQLRSTPDWKMANKLMPKMRVFAPVIVRGEEDKGVRLWEFGKLVYMDMLAFAEDEDVGDFTDPLTGRDIVVDVTSPEQNGTNYNQTKVRIKTKETQLSDNPDNVKTWLENQPNPLELYRRYSYDEMKAALAGFLNPEESQESTPLDTANSSNSSDDIRTGNPLPNDVETKVKGENFGLNVKKKETISADEFDDLFDN